MSMISTQDFQKYLLGYNIIDCAVRRKDFYYFIAREDYTQSPTWRDGQDPPTETALKKRVIAFQAYKPEGQRWSSASLTGFKWTVGDVCISPVEQFVALSISGQSFAVGSGAAGLETEIPYSINGCRGIALKLRTVGTRLLVVGEDRIVGLRQGKDQWQWMSGQIPFDEAKDEDRCGFRDIDGVDIDDLYAVGRNGDVWRGNQGTWRKCAFPSNILLETVCVSPAGEVHISGYEGETYVGGGDQWRQIAKPGLALPFKDIVWFRDRVWCTNDHGLWWIKDGQLAKADVPANVAVCAGNLSTRDDVLLVAGYHGAAVLEGDEWRGIFH